MLAASASASGLSLVQYVPFKASKVFSKVPSDPIALRNRQYEGCATVVPAATWLPPSYTACIVQETAIPCGAPYPAPTCPAASPSPTPQSHPPKSNSDTSQSQSGSQSNTSSDASVNVSGGGDRSGTQNTAIIIGVTIGAVVLLILIVVLAVRGSRRRHSKTPRSERGPVLGNNFFTVGVQPGVRALGVYGQPGQRPIGGGGSGGDGGNGAGGGTLVRNGTGDGRDIGGRISASVGRDPSKGAERRSDRNVSRGTPASIPRSQPLAEPGEAQKADVRPPSSPEQRPSRQPSNTRPSRSRYRPGDHGEHFENGFSYSPGPRLERMRRREQRQQEERGPPEDEHVPPTRAGRESRNPLNIPLPSSPLPNRRGATGEVSRANDDVQSPSTGRWRTGRAYVPYGQRAGGDDESTG